MCERGYCGGVPETRPLQRVRSAIWQTRQLVGATVRRDPLAKELMGQQLLRALRPISPVLAVDRRGRRMFISTADGGEIARAVFATGGYEDDLMRAAMSLIARHTNRPYPLADRVFVDVGANIGVSTIEALTTHHARAAIAFEPNPEAYKLLRHNLLENDLFDRVVTRCQAISDGTGEVELELAPHNWGDHRVRAGGSASSDARTQSDRQTVAVPATTLDAALDAAGVRPTEIGCLWMDTQGHEASALVGTEGLLAAMVPIVCEYWPYGLRDSSSYETFRAWTRAAIGTVFDLANPQPLSPDAALDAADRRLAGSMSHTNLVMLPRH